MKSFQKQPGNPKQKSMMFFPSTHLLVLTWRSGTRLNSKREVKSTSGWKDLSERPSKIL
ncbi:MAG: hypothetical protein PHV06_10630 [bacterium]|nr:hypothetical protein [bacterium]